MVWTSFNDSSKRCRVEKLNLSSFFLVSVRYEQTNRHHWTRPTRTNQAASTLVDLTRSKRELIAENMFLDSS